LLVGNIQAVGNIQVVGERARAFDGLNLVDMCGARCTVHRERPACALDGVETACTLDGPRDSFIKGFMRAIYIYRGRSPVSHCWSTVRRFTKGPHGTRDTYILCLAGPHTRNVHEAV
jgi:hypothetical protein